MSDNDNLARTRAGFMAALNDLSYVQTLLGLAVGQLPDGLDVGIDSYDVLEGKCLVVVSTEKPGVFKLAIRDKPPMNPADPAMPVYIPGSGGEA